MENLKNKNILVTGGSGFVGINLLKKLLNSEANLTATLNDSPSILDDKKINYIKGDLRLKDNCEKAVKDIDYVVMCAANTSGAKIMATTPLVHLTPNILMNMQMLEAAYEANVKKFVFISTNTVYPLTDFPVKEDDVTNEFYESYHIVAWMKRFTELVCDMYSTRIKEPMETIVLRPGNLYGPYDKFDWEKSKVLPALIRRAIERHDPFEVWGDGNDLKDFLYIDDFIDALIMSLYKLETPKPINIASGVPITIKEALNEILIAAKYDDADVQFDSSKPSMIPKRLIDVELAKKLIGFVPKVDFRQGIQNTIDWYREFYAESSPEEKQ